MASGSARLIASLLVSRCDHRRSCAGTLRLVCIWENRNRRQQRRSCCGSVGAAATLILRKSNDCQESRGRLCIGFSTSQRMYTSAALLSLPEDLGENLRGSSSRYVAKLWNQENFHVSLAADADAA